MSITHGRTSRPDGRTHSRARTRAVPRAVHRTLPRAFPRTFVAAGALLLSTVAAVVLLPNTALAAAPAGQESVTAHAGATTDQERGRIDTYWTPERMKLAGAMVPEITPVPEDDDTADDPRPLPADTPDPGGVWTHGGAVNRSVGRLFFTFSDGYDGSCTATVVNSANRSTVMTAAHCLRGVGAPAAEDTWHHNLYFVPGYRNGTKPLGGFVIRSAATSSRWDADPGGTTSADLAVAGYDTGVLVAHRSADGRRIADVTGSQRIAFTRPVEGEFVHTFGYPKDRLNDPGAKYAGSRMIHCAGPARPGTAAPLLWGEPCDMGHGASGGPHFATFDTRTGTGTVVGVTTTSEDLAGGPAATLYATRLGDSAHRLHTWAQTRPA
ncbi:trypsin-like serine peptidase [Kitasatospora sp. NPDC086009]|uniref:trypsin-like serine peptidase n=1 Tax=unclassified Kitasatospora TaxID=2633591 RepID=UPI0037C65F5D